MSLRPLVRALGVFERTACVVAFAVMAAALIADVAARQLLSTGLVGAPQVGVVAMIAAAMFGMGVATDRGAHLRPRVFDGLIPAGWSGGVDRLADALTAVFFVVMAVLSVFVVAESFGLGDRMVVLNVPIWPIQTMIALAFGTNAVRFFAFTLDPALKPTGDADLIASGDAVEEPL